MKTFQGGSSGALVWAFVCAIVGWLPRSAAEMVTIRPVADTTLQEFFPDNNFGAFPHVAAGATGSPRPDGSGPFVTRGLFRFDLAGQIPASAKIVSAKLLLKVTFAPGAARNSTFELRRVLQSWGEGAKGNQSGNTGQPATAGEATWKMRATPGQMWSRPGGAAGVDFSSTISGTVPVAGVGAYTFASTPELVADVEAWLANPATNFGWMLISQSENSPQTARRFGAREDAASAPELVIEFAAPSTALRITHVTRSGRDLTLSWEGAAGPYQLQKKSTVSDAFWSDAGASVNNTSATVAIDGATGVFRVMAGQSPPPAEATARYEVTFEAVWSRTTHPADYPNGAHWSGLVGGTHNDKATFWAEGQLASDGIKDMAELGSKTRLIAEVDAAIKTGTAFGVLSGGGIGTGSGSVKLQFTIQRDFPLVTLVSMIAPSPDWFVGVAGLNLIENGNWVDAKTVTLFLYDAGTDSGPSYASPDQVTSPRQPITKFTTFPALVNGTIVPFGAFTFRKL